MPMRPGSKSKGSDVHTTVRPMDTKRAVIFGLDYRVLRGGSWAARLGVMCNAFRDRDFPIRR